MLRDDSTARHSLLSIHIYISLSPYILILRQEGMVLRDDTTARHSTIFPKYTDIHISLLIYTNICIRVARRQYRQALSTLYTYIHSLYIYTYLSPHVY